ncbi:hypothetical protein BG004_008282 [Podila humilis]|nr:hypothetical protein BG004_008282 [Podila humilis]
MSTPPSIHQWPPHPLLIPELRDPITATLALQEFVACARVCRLWHFVFTPYVWHTIRGSKHLPNDFTRQGKHVRALIEVSTAQADLLLDRMRENCLHLESIQLSWHAFYEDQFEMFFLGIKPRMQRQQLGSPPRLSSPSPQQLKAKPNLALLESNSSTITSIPNNRAVQNTEDGSEPMSVSDHPEAATRLQVVEESKPQTIATASEKALVRAKLAPDALSIISRAAGRSSLIPELKKVTKPRAVDHQDGHQRISCQPTRPAVPHNTRVLLPELPGTIPESVPNGFLASSVHTLILQVHHETILSILLWFTRAGLQGQLQGLKRFELSGHETMSIMTSKGKRFIPVSAANTGPINVHAGILHDLWAVLPCLETCSIHGTVITGDLDEVGKVSSDQGSGSNPGSGSGSSSAQDLETETSSGTNPKQTISAQEALRIKRGQIARSGRHPGYLSEVVSNLTVICRLIAAEPDLGISTLTTLHLNELETLASFRALFKRLPYLTHLRLNKVGDPRFLALLPNLCPRLRHFSYFGQSKRGHAATGFEWQPFFKVMMATTLQEVVLKNVYVTDQDLRTLAITGAGTLRVLLVQGGDNSGCTWKGAKAVLENSRVLQRCTLACYGPVDELFAHDPEFSALMVEQGVEEEVLPRGQSRWWACRKTLETLCLYGLVLYNPETNLKLFEQICTLREMKSFTITGRGVSLEALLGPQTQIEVEETSESPAVGAESSSSSRRMGASMATSLYPKLETIDLPRLAKKLTSKDLLEILKALPSLQWFDVGGAYEMEALIWLETVRSDLTSTFVR